MATDKQTHSSEPKVGGSQFVSKLLELPVVKFGVDKATHLYSSVKESNIIIGKSFELGEAISGAVVNGVTPFANKGISIAGPALKGIDNIAVDSLETLEHNIPLIHEQPDTIVNFVKDTISGALQVLKGRVTRVSDVFLGSKPAQTYFDVLEFVLTTANKTLDKVLPDQTGKGHTTDDYPPPEKKADRGWYLLGKFVELAGTTKDRIFGKFWKRVDDSSATLQNAKDAMKNFATTALTSSEKPNATNGDSSKANNSATNAPKGKKKVEKHSESTN